ncbi:hypothetical protein IBE48_09735 [Francisella philomiragia]|uniref:hypothetical protein n=1 Tax=Francisella philomiragia TaxID=28110 RepID=UPI0019075F2F|nr:hypothetical protein [Francisella philomiragia]MBK2255731.1 hypothetical protein [Francisella philomiragia]MBK2274045.1 hypothetical protein [Francisella philomiragia]MBK2277884.1 hypothetical protein [Francisella philomiragia]MBK2281828.1 hypothetical protein [Francisella philomiragia]MBK2283780.1 hypothetical protein [Francisella philomiragia]
MSKIKVNLTIKKYSAEDMKWSRKKTSILIDKFLFDVVIYKLRRKKEYITNKGNPKKKWRAKNHYKELIAKSDNNLMSNFLSHKISTYGIYDSSRIEGKTITEIANEILIKKVMSRTLKDELKIY